MSRPPADRRRIALERSRERRFHEEIEKLERDQTRAASASTSYPSHRINIGDDQQQHYSVASSRNNNNDPANYSNSSAPRSEGGSGGFSPPNNNNSYQRSPLEFQGQHISFLPPHVIESLRPYYKNAAESMPQRDEAGRPRPPSFVFAPKHLDSGNIPAHHYQDYQQQTNNNNSGNYSPPGQRPIATNTHQQQQQTPRGSYGSNNNYEGFGGFSERGNVASSTQTNFDPNAKVSYVDISASNAVLQRRVERLEQQLQESVQQKDKLNQIIKSMSYSIVPPLSFLPKDFYEKNKSVIDTCSDYAILYRTALRATPNVGGDLDSFEKKIEEQSKEHLMDRVVCLTSETMSLKKLIADMERVNAMSP